ncbi:hypothetical protein F5Y10DRAFT_225626 [Nemania abortiva]|nr:hypothetical protein F5Y10DRAFT_225626 [Nemania abortiva]
MRRHHTKSRRGCTNCKRRKVKCDENRPQCVRCVDFGVRCSFVASSTSGEPSGPESPPTALEQVPIRTRGRGRPRKDWSISREAHLPSPPVVSEATAAASASTSPNIGEAELLLHFTHHTAPSLADSTATNNYILRFWSYNLPRIGLTHHFVLHLAYTLAAYHLAYLETSNHPKKLQYREMARHHSSLGLPQLTQALAGLNKDNCGAVYAAASLMCYCTFAAGPTDPGDLLVCNVGSRHDVAWLPLIYGVRLIREKFDEDELFTGLMEPFHRKFHTRTTQSEEDEGRMDTRQPRCTRENFPRLNWHEPLRKLQDCVYSQAVENQSCLSALENMISIYEATYGDEDAVYDGPSENQFVFGWLYRLEKQFVICLQRKDPIALVILSYYAVLIGTMERLWYMTGWADHLVQTVKALVHDDYVKWLEWPADSLQHISRPILATPREHTTYVPEAALRYWHESTS